MEERATGIILRVRPFSETSLVAHGLTRELGRIAFIAQGARRLKSPFRGKIDVGYRADFLLQKRTRSALYLLKEISLLDPAARWRADLGALQQFAYAVALIERATETDTPAPEFYELLAGFAEGLPFGAPRNAIFGFEARLLRALGLSPDARSGLSGGAVELLKNFLNLDWNLLGRLNLHPRQRSEINAALAGLLADQLGQIPPARRNWS